MKIQICSQMGQAILAHLATNLDFHSLGYRDHISCDIEKLEQFHFRLTGPTQTQLKINFTGMGWVSFFALRSGFGFFRLEIWFGTSSIWIAQTFARSTSVFAVLISSHKG